MSFARELHQGRRLLAGENPEETTRCLAAPPGGSGLHPREISRPRFPRPVLLVHSHPHQFPASTSARSSTRGQIHLIDDHLCVLSGDASTWLDAPSNYLTVHGVGMILALSPTIEILKRNFLDSLKSGGRATQRFTIPLLLEEWVISFTLKETAW